MRSSAGFYSFFDFDFFSEAGSRCIQSEHTGANVSKSFATMSVTSCTQFCKGKRLKYAVIENTECQCMDNLPSHHEVNLAECNRPCTGHEYQFCGGKANDTYSVIDGLLDFIQSHIITKIISHHPNLFTQNISIKI